MCSGGMEASKYFIVFLTEFEIWKISFFPVRRCFRIYRERLSVERRESRGCSERALIGRCSNAIREGGKRKEFGRQQPIHG